MANTSLVLLITQVLVMAVLVIMLYIVLRLRELGYSIEELREQLKSLQMSQKKIRQIEKALSLALESKEAERLIEFLKRKRRRRYIVFQVITEDGQPVNPNELEKAIVRSVTRLAGDLTVAKGRIRLVYYHPDKMLGILAATHDTKYLVIASMALARRVGERRVLLIPLKTTGTIKRAKKVIGLPLREQ